MCTDRFTKIMLLLIALGLFWNALNPWLLPKPVTAAGSTLDVNIAKIGGAALSSWYAPALPVKIK